MKFLKNNQLLVNMFANILSFIVSMGINFLLTPYIVKEIGSDAYGFVGLANNFISFIQLVTVALNSMASRFIAISVHEGNKEKANKYYNTVIYGNAILLLLTIIPCFYITYHLNTFINIPTEIIWDIKMLFFVLIINLYVNLFLSTFTIATFITNRLELSSFRTIESNIIRVAVLILMFLGFVPRVWFIGFSILVASTYLLCANYRYTKKLTEYLYISRHQFNLKLLKELMVAGFWNIITKVSQLLETGFDLILTNLFLGATQMGTLSIAKTLPNMMVGFIGSFVSVFGPQFTTLYAQKKNDELKENVFKSVKILSNFNSLLFAGVLVYSKVFYSLWVPSEDSQLLYILTILSVMQMPITSSLNTLYTIFTVTNKVKVVSITLLVMNVVNILFVLLALNFTDLGIYAVAGFSSTLAILTMLFFTIPYAAKSLNLKWWTFYSAVIICIKSNLITILVFLIINTIYTPTGWISLFVSGGISCLLGLIANMLINMNAEERIAVYGLFKRGKKYEEDLNC